MERIALGLLVCLCMTASTSALPDRGRGRIVLMATDGSPSHSRAMLTYGHLLARRGYDVSYASWAEHAALALRHANISFHSLGPSPLSPEALAQFGASSYTTCTPDGTKETLGGAMRVMARMNRVTYRPAYEAFDDLLGALGPVDVVLCDFFSTACADVARTRNLSHVVQMNLFNFGGHTTSPLIQDVLSPYQAVTRNDLTWWQRLRAMTLVPLKKLYYLGPLLYEKVQLQTTLGATRPKMLLHPYRENLIIMSTFFGFEQARYLSPLCQVVGPIFSPTYDPLSADLQATLDHVYHHPNRANRPGRVAFMAFGARFQHTPTTMTDLLTALRRLLQEDAIDLVIWANKHFDMAALARHNRTLHDAVQSDPALHIMPWAPQWAILAHPASRLFISHGGVDSLHEAFYHGVPTLVVPIGADQIGNGYKVATSNAGRHINPCLATSDTYYDTMTDFLATTHAKNASTPTMQAIHRMKTMTRLLGRGAAARAADLVEMVLLDQQSPRAFIPIEDTIPFYMKHHLDSVVPLFVMAVALRYMLHRASGWRSTTTCKPT